jgi:peptidoglycan/xylan/chitin deacetylase (PgdA/CDA1 family)
MKLEDAKGVRSTFFFLPYGDGALHICDGDYRLEDRIGFDGRLVRISDVIKAIADAGWEIGLHGTIRSARTPGLLARQKQQLEAIIQGPVVSVRQHYLSYDSDLTPGLQAAAGFWFDSTHGFGEHWGFPAGTCHPYHLWDPLRQAATDLLEFPMAMMDTARRLPQRTLHEMEGLLREAYTIMSAVSQHQGTLVLNWHPNYWSMGIAKETYDLLVDESLRRGAFVGPLRAVGESTRTRLRLERGAMSPKTSADQSFRGEDCGHDD